MANYKFKDTKTYTSTEWMIYGKKKYRKVFQRKDVDYLYFELSIYNLRYQEDDWDTKFQITCYQKTNSSNKKICDLKFEKLIPADNNIFTLREGWGNIKKGQFWKKGEYFWEARINGELVGIENFYIEDFGSESLGFVNEIIQLKEVKLREGAEKGQMDFDAYYNQFDLKKSRFIYVNMVFENLYNIDRDYWIEVFLNFYTESRDLKGIASKVLKVHKDDETVEFNLGWGSETPGTWYEGEYFVDIVAFEELIATVRFDVDHDFVEGKPDIFFPGDISPSILKEINQEEESSLEDLLKKLDELVGLQEIKSQIKDHAKYIQFIKLRKEKGYKEEDDIDVHMVFMGNPGTGKTTVAEMMGMIYKKMGIISRGHVHSVDRVDLVGEYIGQTAPKVKTAIEKAKGGVLFIDEAYSLSRDNSDSKDFGREVIEILVKEMSDGDGDLVVIAAGYPKEMEYFINSNPGLKSRFKLFYNFPDYLPQELSGIADIAARKKEVKFTFDAKKKLDEIITKAFRERDKSFGNARYVYDLVEKSKINMALRLMASDNINELEGDSLQTIELADIEKLENEKLKVLPDIPIDEELLQEAFDELNKLIGLEKVKQEIIETVGVVRYHLGRGKNVLNNFYLHTVFIGNPGTGKTTVARILTKIYKALGILERGHMVETDRQGLVAGYIGQTAIKTAKKIDEAMGGVLFIDEAYSLTASGMNSDYGSEAIQTILKRMEDNRGEFFVFAAGYPENMEKFLKSNPGLQSRFDKILKFEDYSAQQLTDIAVSMFDEKDLVMEEQAKKVLHSYLENLLHKKDKYFGNARRVRKIVTEITENQNIRIASMPTKSRKGIDFSIVEVRDVQKAINEATSVFDKKGIGFKTQGSR